MIKLATVFTIIIFSTACVVHKSEDRKNFEANGYKYISSHALTFQLLNLDRCSEFTPQTLATKLQIDAQNIISYANLVLREKNEYYCFLTAVDPGNSRTRSWICPNSEELTCWEHIN